MQINRAHLVWEVGDANTVSRGGGHCGKLETSGKEKVRTEQASLFTLALFGPPFTARASTLCASLRVL
jgi:hypothetical protein